MKKTLNFDTQASYDAIKNSLEYPTITYIKETDIMYIMQPSLYDYVDLGLSVKWAAWNVGATKPEEYGLYFAWGETQGYNVYNVEGSYSGTITDANGNETDKKFEPSYYEFSIDGSGSNLSKYNSTDGLTTLEQSDDAAYQYDNTCRMPTSDECQELINNTTSAWTTDYNGSGISGVVLTSKVEGYTDKSIFLPAAGGCDGTNISGGRYSGNYWSSSLHNEQKTSGHFLFISTGNVVNAYGFRYYGFKIRAVLPKP